MAALQWSPSMRLGVEVMDRGHQALLSRLKPMACSSDAELRARMPELIAGMEQSFREEEALMAAIAFPNLTRHSEQHARILYLLRIAQAALERADGRPARDAIALMPHWFLIHLSTMDIELSVALAMVSPQADAACGRAAQMARDPEYPARHAPEMR